MIKFEMNIIDPRANCFDHHGDISHSNAFVAKMSSLQLLEKMLCTGDMELISREKVKLDHVGHMDDIILHAIQPAIDAGKVRNLYSFACRISVLDSLGPIGYNCLMDVDRNIVNEAYETFQAEISRVAKKLEIDRYKVELGDKIIASMIAAEVIVNNLQVDNYTPPTIDPPDQKKYDMERIDDIFHMRINDSSCNPFVSSAYFYKQGCRILVASTYHEESEVWTYAILARSSYEVDLTNLWSILTEYEGNGKTWGGHAGAGGSPRKNGDFKGGSIIPPEQVLSLVIEHSK